MIINKFFSFLKKYLILINIFFITILICFYFLNPQKFDTYRIYLTYDFDERKMLNRGEPFQFVANFLSELSFSKEFKRNLDEDKSEMSDKVNVQINLNNNQIRFDFKYKSQIINNKTSVMKAEKIKSITKQMEGAIENYHKNLKEMLTEKKLQVKGSDNFWASANELVVIKFSEFLVLLNNEEVMRVEMEGNTIKGVLKNNKTFLTYSPNDPNLVQKIMDKGVSITAVRSNRYEAERHATSPGNYFTVVQEEYLDLLNNGRKIIMIKGYNEKFRRLFLNTDEYLISSLILLVLFNFVVKNSSVILK